MPLRGVPTCLKCETTESPLWTNAESLGAICLNCVNEAKDTIKNEAEEEDETGGSKKKKFKATRSYKTRLNPFALPKTPAPKGRGRRSMFKKTPIKAPTATATTVTSDYVYYKVRVYFVG